MTERLHFHFSLSCIGEGNGNPLQCSCLENPRDGGAWWAAVSGVAQSRTRLKRLSSSSGSSSRAATTKYPKLCGLNNRNVLSHSSGDQRSKIKMLSWFLLRAMRKNLTHVSPRGSGSPSIPWHVDSTLLVSPHHLPPDVSVFVPQFLLYIRISVILAQDSLL